MKTINLPTASQGLEPYRLSEPRKFVGGDVALSRVAYSAAHVVAHSAGPSIDWDATLEYRHHLWSLGLGVAEAMDTAQRGMGLGWPEAQQLIERSLRAASTIPSARIACGVGTDHLLASPELAIDDVVKAYETQAEFVEGRGGRIILMASRALARAAKTSDDYVKVYDRILGGVREPVILHWLGDMFDPALAGYWGASNIDAAMNIALEIIERNTSKVDGIKISLLDKDKEIAMRRRLPQGVRMYTGDDFNYAELIAGDGFGTGTQRHSDALLGIFDPIAPAASAALCSLARGDLDEFYEILGPTVPLSRLIFEAPTRFYKTGVVFMAYLNGHQSHFHMIDNQENARSILHLSEVFRLADAAGLLNDPDRATQRMSSTLKQFGVV